MNRYPTRPPLWNAYKQSIPYFSNSTRSRSLLALGLVPTILVAFFSLECFLFHDQSIFLKWQGQLISSRCPSGTFKLDGMATCHPILGCAEVTRDLKVTDHLLGEGAQKIVKKGVWQGHEVAVSSLKHKGYIDDFLHGLDMLRLFNEDPGHQENRIVQLLGWCFDNVPVIVTEMHRHGAANNIHAILEVNFPDYNFLLPRFRMCVEFVQILRILHSHPKGTRVMCDANYPEKALSQFLVSDNLSLILNDVDALPLVDKKSGHLVKCGHQELQGDFVAPEQRWDSDEVYNDHNMPHYDEKVDIWKIPDVCNYLVGDVSGASKLHLRLFNIHSRCKQTDPLDRPSAGDVLTVYEQVYEKLKKII